MQQASSAIKDTLYFRHTHSRMRCVSIHCEKRKNSVELFLNFKRRKVGLCPMLLHRLHISNQQHMKIKYITNTIKLSTTELPLNDSANKQSLHADVIYQKHDQASSNVTEYSSCTGAKLKNLHIILWMYPRVTAIIKMHRTLVPCKQFFSYYYIRWSHAQTCAFTYFMTQINYAYNLEDQFFHCLLLPYLWFFKQNLYR